MVDEDDDSETEIDTERVTEGEEDEDEADDEDLFELERSYERTELAALFQAYGSALADGDPLTVETDEAVVSMAVPSEVDVELEGEREGGEDSPIVEFEIELEWPDANGESVRVDPIEEPAGGSGDEEGDGEPEGDRSTGRERTAHFEVYQDRADEWRWRLVHWNGNIIADSGEGYATRQNAIDGLESVKRNAPGAAVERADTDSS